MVKVYIAPEVLEVEALHPYLRDSTFRAMSIRDQIAKQADVVYAAHTAGDRRVRMQLMSWWPQARGRSLDEVMSLKFGLCDARQTMAREHGFEDWSQVETLGTATLSLAFEQALDDLLAGDLQALREKLDQETELVHDRSAFGHRATLLHYLGANGVESHRQRTPLNAASLAALLIERGADRQAAANMYGGGQTPYALATTSAHPYEAGISDALNRVLKGQ